MRDGDRLTYIGGLPTAETFALPYLEMGVTTYSSAIFNFLPEFAQDFYAAVRRRDHEGLQPISANSSCRISSLRNRRKGYAVSIVEGRHDGIGRPAGPVRLAPRRSRSEELASLKQLIRRPLLTGLPIAVHDSNACSLPHRPMLFVASAFSYGDRFALSIAGIALSRDLHINPLQLGYLFSGFSWAYVVAQLPAGVCWTATAPSASTASASSVGRPARCSSVLPDTSLQPSPSPRSLFFASCRD